MDKLKAGFDFIASSYKKTAAVLFIGAIVLSIPFTLSLLGQQQDIRQRAEGQTATSTTESQTIPPEETEDYAWDYNVDPVPPEIEDECWRQNACGDLIPEDVKIYTPESIEDVAIPYTELSYQVLPAAEAEPTYSQQDYLSLQNGQYFCRFRPLFCLAAPFLEVCKEPLIGWCEPQITPTPIQCTPYPPDCIQDGKLICRFFAYPPGGWCPIGGTGGTVCTQDVKICPDGSYVGRTGPNCEFAACPLPTGPITPTLICKTGVNGFGIETQCAENRYRYMTFSCYDGFGRREGSETSCKSREEWAAYAERYCIGHSSCSPTLSPVQYTTITGVVGINSNNVPYKKVSIFVSILADQNDISKAFSSMKEIVIFDAGNSSTTENKVYEFTVKGLISGQKYGIHAAVIGADGAPNYSDPSISCPNAESIRTPGGGGYWACILKAPATQSFKLDVIKFGAINQCGFKMRGDANCDGKINTEDFNIWRDEFKNPVYKNGGPTPHPDNRANFNSDNVINLDDFNIWRSGFLDSSLPH
jgi:hypothetical protein